MSVHNDNISLNSISSDQRQVRHTIHFLSKKLVKGPLKNVWKGKMTVTITTYTWELCKHTKVINYQELAWPSKETTPKFKKKNKQLINEIRVKPNQSFNYAG